MTTNPTQPNPVQPDASPSHLLPPPHRVARTFKDDPSDPSSPSNPGSYIRDPHKLIAYLVPFPPPNTTTSSHASEPGAPPLRFLIYTPPPPPLLKPAEGEKEGHTHKIQRKWQHEVREAKTTQAKTASWKGIKGKATKGINWAVTQISSADLDFVTRIPDAKSHASSAGHARTPSPGGDRHADDGVHEEDTTTRTVGLEEMVIVYPPSIGLDEVTLREEFVNTLLRTKSKAERDSVIATGLLPVAAAVDVALTLVWPFGGLLEVDGVWAFSSIKGAKTARGVTKRLASSTQSGQLDSHQEEQLKLTFAPTSRVEVLHEYLVGQCVERDNKVFRKMGPMPAETEVLDAIGWTPSERSEERNWEDEAWEKDQVREDLRQVFRKAAKAWDKWCKAYAKNPEKAVKK